MAEFGLTPFGVSTLVRSLDDYGDTIKDLRAPLTSLMLTVVNPMLQRRFADEGPGWAPLSRGYADWKAIHFPGKGIGRRTDAMQTAFSGGVGSEFTVTADSLTVNPTRIKYWKFFDQGTKRMPARRILGFDGGEIRQMSDYITKWLFDRARTYGLEVRG